MSTESIQNLQGAAAWALADLMQHDGLPALSWFVPGKDGPAAALVGVRDDGDPAGRVDAVDEWARLLQVVPAWSRFNESGGEYVATGVHLGALVSVRAWLSAEPAEALA